MLFTFLWRVRKQVVSLFFVWEEEVSLVVNHREKKGYFNSEVFSLCTFLWSGEGLEEGNLHPTGTTLPQRRFGHGPCWLC